MKLVKPLVFDTSDSHLVVIDVEDNVENIKAVWCSLVSQCAPSYFLTWGWVQAWLQELPSDCKVYFVYKCLPERAVMGFFIGMKCFKRNKFFKVRQLCLNVSGQSEYDNIWLEYNSILCIPDFKFDFETILKEIPLSWEELYLPGLDLSSFPGNDLSSLSVPFRYIEDVSTISPYVDLEKVRQAGGDYLSLLSSNTRTQIRRSLKILEEIGPVELDVPDSLERAFQIYREMVDLHQATWKARGENGVFSSSLVYKFHERLIRNRFDKGEIQLLRIHTGGKTIGCLYSFVWQGRVYFYQCGFDYSFGKKVKPGLVSHLMAVQYNTEQGHDVYDFLAGDARYKRSLATDFNNMSWGRVQRLSWKLKLEEKLRSFYGRLRGNAID